MLLMRPDAAHRVTVFGSTRKRAATSPGVRRRSLFPSTLHPSCLRFGACLQCRENIRLLPRFPEKLGACPCGLPALAGPSAAPDGRFVARGCLTRCAGMRYGKRLLIVGGMFWAAIKSPRGINLWPDTCPVPQAARGLPRPDGRAVGQFADPHLLSGVIPAELGIRESVRLMVPTITIGAGVPDRCRRP